MVFSDRLKPAEIIDTKRVRWRGQTPQVAEVVELSSHCVS